MRFGLKYLAKRLYVIYDRFFTTYMSGEVQSKRTDDLIINFPILNSKNIDDYEYIMLKIGSKKCTDNLEIKIKQIEDNEYLCETVQGALMNNIL